MEWKKIEEHWKDVKGPAKKQWEKLSEADLEQIGGNKDRLVAKVREKYGMSAQDAELRVDRFRGSLTLPVEASKR
jgi:uncharacterized protein YjbJ (UPF0337 family)